jgi:hypothetical protein
MPSPRLINVISIVLIIGSLVFLILGGTEWYKYRDDCKDDCNNYKYLTIGGGIGLIIGSILAFLNYEGRFETVDVSSRLTPVVPNIQSNVDSI